MGVDLNVDEDVDVVMMDQAVKGKSQLFSFPSDLPTSTRGIPISITTAWDSEVVECHELTVAACARDLGVPMVTKLVVLDRAADVGKEGPRYESVSMADDNPPCGDNLLDDPDALPPWLYKQLSETYQVPFRVG